MAEMVTSVVVQEVVSGAFSSMRNSHEESASQSHLLEKLKMACLELKFALERSRKMPITEVSLLQQRMMFKLAFEECRDLLHKHEEGVERRVPPLSPSVPRRIMLAVRHFFSSGNGLITRSCVTRFEWFAEKANKLVGDVESGCSLARYRFSCPLITQLLQGKVIRYRMERGSQTLCLAIDPSFLEDYGAHASLRFDFIDLETPMKCFGLSLLLRLSESTDIVGISTRCLQSLGPLFKPVADAASGELAQISTQVGSFIDGPAQREIWFNVVTSTARFARQEPFCCIGDGFQPSAKNTFSSVLTERFPEQVSILMFECFIPAAEYRFEDSTIVKACPVLRLSVAFLPHFKDDKARTDALTSRGEICEPLNCLQLLKMAGLAIVRAVDCFDLEPERTEYVTAWYVSHGRALFTVKKPTTEMGCATKVGNGSKTRRASKRKR